MATWYYVENGQQAGPVTDDDLRLLVNQGRIVADTLVWNETMTEWQAYAHVRSAAVQAQAETLSTGAEPGADADQLTPLRAAGAEPVAASALTCAECGMGFPAEELIPIGGQWICASCKPIALQKFREGVGIAGTMRYGGFWIRFAAKFIDGLIMFGINMVVGLIIQGVFVGIGAATGMDKGVAGIVGTVIAWFIQMGLGLAFTVYFLGKFAATPGKMACGLKVVRSDGSAVTYGRALGRHFGDMLSGLTLCIGYIIAAFDDEKRALHDHICDTRVIYK